MNTQELITEIHSVLKILIPIGDMQSIQINKDNVHIQFEKVYDKKSLLLHFCHPNLGVPNVSYSICKEYLDADQYSENTLTLICVLNSLRKVLYIKDSFVSILIRFLSNYNYYDRGHNFSFTIHKGKKAWVYRAEAYTVFNQITVNLLSNDYYES